MVVGGIRLTSCRPGDGAADGAGGGREKRSDGVTARGECDASAVIL